MIDLLLVELKESKELYRHIERTDELMAALIRGLVLRNIPIYEVCEFYIKKFTQDLLSVIKPAKEAVANATTLVNKYKETFEIQQFAAEGKSICKFKS